MTSGMELVRGLQAAAQGTPYVVTQTPTGFTLEHNFLDQAWLNQMGAGNVQRTFTIEAVLEESDHTMLLTDSTRDVSWSVGAAGHRVPRLSASMQVQKGTIVQKSFGASAVPSVLPGDVATWDFSSEEMKRWLATQAGQLGWSRSRKLDTNSKIGLVFAVLGLLAVLVVGLAALFGVLG